MPRIGAIQAADWTLLLYWRQLLLHAPNARLLVTKGIDLDASRAAGGLSLVYVAGRRPCADDIARLLQTPRGSDDTGQTARISHRPDDAEGWVELLASGLTFDLAGLAPSASSLPSPADYRYGLSADFASEPLEAVTLLPGPNVASGAAMIPVVRVMSGLALRLALEADVKAVVWGPARCWMEPGYFQRTIDAWLAGGAFPALGLTALERTADGGMESVGLTFFIGTEVRIEPLAGEPAATTMKLAVRVIDLLVRHGALAEPMRLTGPDGEGLLAEPGGNGAPLRVWRKA